MRQLLAQAGKHLGGGGPHTAPQLEGFGSLLDQHAQAIAHVEAWLAGDEVEADAPLVASALWIAAFGSGVLPLRATVEDATDPSWDDFLKGKKSVTKQEIREFVEANQVRIDEVV